MTREKFVEHIKDQEFTWCRIYDHNDRLVAQYSFGEAEGSDQPKNPVREFVKRIEAFADNFPGNYSIHCKKFPHSKDETTCKLSVTFGNNDLKEISPVQTPIDIKAIKEEILQGLRIEQEKKDKEEEIQELKEELRQMKTMGGKLNYILGEFLTTHLPKLIKPKQAGLAGTESNSGEDITPDQNERIRQAVFKLLKHMNIETLEAFAQKIDTNPDLVNTLKSFL